MDEMSAVTHEPMLEPKIINNMAFPPPPMIRPCVAIAMMMVVTADEDCNNAVKIIPNNKSKKGLLIALKKLVTSGIVLYPLIESDIISKPKNTRPNPASAKPMDLILSSFESISIITPIKRRAIKKGAISNELSAASCAVIVVPMFAPMIIVAA